MSQSGKSIDAGAPRIYLVAAVAANGVIGVDGKLPWHLPEDLKHFKKLTLGHPVIMGRKTWESIGRVLPGRETVIVTRQPGYRVPGAKIAHSLDEAIAGCGSDSEIFVIGGAELYAQALPRAGRLYLTTVEAEVAGDTFMPEFDARAWRQLSSTSHGIDERHRFAYQCVTYERNGH